MIFDTGDIHGDPYVRFSTMMFPQQKQMTKDDYVIINGDAGLVWYQNPNHIDEVVALNWLEDRPFTTLFCDGNHENFERLNKYPVEEWNGGLIHRIRPSVIHLMRGQVYTIEGKKFFVFGGARSTDIKHGILEPTDVDTIKKWQKDQTKLYRVNRISWWEEEMPTKEEMKIGLENLAKHNFEVDYIISHEMPASTLTLYCALYGANGFYKPDELNHYLEEVRAKTKYKLWLCGHYHDDRNITQQDCVLYETFKLLSTC